MIADWFCLEENVIDGPLIESDAGAFSQQRRKKMASRGQRYAPTIWPEFGEQWNGRPIEWETDIEGGTVIEWNRPR